LAPTPPLLRLADELALPLDAVTRTFAIVGQRGSGKTTTAAVLVEEIAPSARFVVVDPTGAWFGLRTAADGKGPGLSVVVLGGHHGDAPLEESAGPLVADLVIREGLSLVLDLELLRKGQQIRFVCEFLEALYHGNREALHVVVDECQRFAPQQLRESGGLRGALPGRRRGHRQARPAQGTRRVGDHAAPGRAEQGGARAGRDADGAPAAGAARPQGHRGLVRRAGRPARGSRGAGRAPDAQDRRGVRAVAVVPRVLRARAVRAKRTFDSSATPAVGKRRTEPVGRAEIDLEAIRARLASAIEKAKADDPKALRARITELERELAKRPTEVRTVRVEVPVVPAAFRAALTLAVGSVIDPLKEIAGAVEAIQKLIASESGEPNVTTTRIYPVLTPPERTLKPEKPEYTVPVGPVRIVPVRAPQPAPSVDGAKLGLAERKILTALAQYPGGRTAVQVAVLTGYAVNGGGFRNALGALRTKGYLEGGRDQPLRATESGLDALGPVEPLPTGPALVDHWMAQLSKAERGALSALVVAYPSALTAQEVAERAGYEANGGGFRNALGRLRTLELIEGRGAMRASDTFFSS
jgi:hypothetical protein